MISALFDRDHDGGIDKAEFLRFMNLARAQHMQSSGVVGSDFHAGFRGIEKLRAISVPKFVQIDAVKSQEQGVAPLIGASNATAARAAIAAAGYAITITTRLKLTMDELEERYLMHQEEQNTRHILSARGDIIEAYLDRLHSARDQLGRFVSARHMRMYSNGSPSVLARELNRFKVFSQT